MKIFTMSNISKLDFTLMIEKVRPVEAVEIEEEFQVATGTGDILVGAKGDYLVCLEDARLVVVEREKMEKGYRPYRSDVDGIKE